MAGIENLAVFNAFAERLSTVASLPQVQWINRSVPNEPTLGTVYVRGMVGRSSEVKMGPGFTVGKGVAYFEVLHSDSDETQIEAAETLAEAIKAVFPPDDNLSSDPQVRVMSCYRPTAIIDSPWRSEPIAVEYEAYTSR